MTGFPSPADMKDLIVNRFAKWKTAGAILALCLSMAVVLRWLWSGVFLSEIQSDTVETLFWAEAARESGGLFGTTFHYSYFIPFGGSLLIRPFLSLFGMSLAAHRAGMSLFVLIFAIACYRLFRSFRWSRAEGLLASTLLFAVASASLKMREIYFGHVIYYSWAPRLFNSDSRWYEPDPKRTRTVFVCHPHEEPFAPSQGRISHHRCFQKTGRLGYCESLLVLVYDGDCLERGTEGTEAP